ncbi:MAG: hypothetical protein HFI15_01370 [Lachnospiraceae bacterium]|nr:hypothetical protein [Lachnospiraceae bacterium]
MCIKKDQIAFITCVSDEEEYAECRYYLNRLRIPDGYETDIISVREAPSMAAGYNAGMKSSPAKYKVYLHQDVFIKNQNFISDMLQVFHRDAQIGVLGMIGKRNREMQGISLMKWDTGKVIDNSAGLWSFSIPSKEDNYAEVLTVDGLLMVTQYDILWREDLFNGWDLYDASQCMEFIKRGYKIVVPYQKEEWCYHDCLYPKLIKYFDYNRVFLKEYIVDNGLSFLNEDPHASSYENEKEVAQAVEDMRNGMETLIESEDRGNLRIFLENPSGLKNLAYMKEYAAVVHIDYLEEMNQSEQRLWESGMSLEQLLKKLRALKYMLKRLEYTAEFSGAEQIYNDYSNYAIMDLCERYVMEKEKVYNILYRYQPDKQNMDHKRNQQETGK